MKNFVFIFLVTIFTLSSCSDSKDDASKYIYENGKRKVQLRILNGKDYLVWDTPTKVNFEWTNVDTKNSLISGIGIKILEANENVTKTEINVPSKYLKKDSLTIKVSFKINKIIKNTVFKIPLRKMD